MKQIFEDPTLLGNELIEEAVRLYREEESEWRFMGVLMEIRERMQEDGHLIFPADVITEEDGSQRYGLKTIDADDGVPLLVAFTSQAEFKKAPPSSAISSYIDIMLETVLRAEAFGGIILNPWGQEITIDRADVALILSPGSERFIR